MITQEIVYKTGMLVVFLDESPSKRDTYELKVFVGVIQIDDTLYSKYTLKEFQGRQPIIIGVVLKTWYGIKYHYYYST